jgi:ABC-type dipeptide/oligopeptide/nickel transport system permease component
MPQYLAKRVGSMLVTVFVVITLNFLLFRVMPGNAVSDIDRVPGSSPALQRALEQQFGLNHSLPVQYWDYLAQLVHGNLGISYAYQQPVAGLLGTALEYTLPMVGAGFLLALILGTATGAIAAWRRGTFTDGALSNLAIAFYAAPAQFLGLGLVMLFTGVLPTAGAANPFAVGGGFWSTLADHAQHMVLPSLTFALAVFGQYTLVLRASLLETLGEDYALTARATGNPPRRALTRHVLPNALLPFANIAALQLGSLVAGAILIEVVFSWPGVGTALYNAVVQRDYPMMQGIFLVLTLAVVICNFGADLLCRVLDPRTATDLRTAS